jgi:hypothetical protein
VVERHTSPPLVTWLITLLLTVLVGIAAVVVFLLVEDPWSLLSVSGKATQHLANANHRAGGLMFPARRRHT